jgi:hypothetical protein
MSSPKLYSTREAAQFLGIKEETVKYHVYTSQTLHPDKIGHTLVFTEEELNRFKQEKRPPHRPKRIKASGNS